MKRCCLDRNTQVVGDVLSNTSLASRIGMHLSDFACDCEVDDSCPSFLSVVLEQSRELVVVYKTLLQ